MLLFLSAQYRQLTYEDQGDAIVVDDLITSGSMMRVYNLTYIVVLSQLRTHLIIHIYTFKIHFNIILFTFLCLQSRSFLNSTKLCIHWI
jgi:hypothetical protein